MVFTGRIWLGGLTYHTAACDAARFPDEVFQKCSNRLRRARFINGDFEKVLHHAEKGDLVYMDPPFAVRARRVFENTIPVPSRMKTFKLTQIVDGATELKGHNFCRQLCRIRRGGCAEEELLL